MRTRTLNSAVSLFPAVSPPSPVLFIEPFSGSGVREEAFAFLLVKTQVSNLFRVGSVWSTSLIRAGERKLKGQTRRCTYFCLVGHRNANKLIKWWEQSLNRAPDYRRKYGILGIHGSAYCGDPVAVSPSGLLLSRH